MSSITNWVSGESDLARVQNARIILNKVKQEKYGKHNTYRLEKTGDHPLTYREVLVVGKEKLEVDHTAEVDEEEIIEEVDFSTIDIKEE
jgi:hypothetical protein